MTMNTDEDGYHLWLRYRPVDNMERLTQYRNAISGAVVAGTTATAAIIKSELARALPALLDSAVPLSEKPVGNTLVVGTIDELKAVGVAIPSAESCDLGAEGFLIRSQQVGNDNWICITANSASAVLTGTFHFLRLVQTHQDIHALDLSSRSRIRHRVLAHWDNLDGSIERGYAGRSLWNWDELPKNIDPRYRDYARACASIGINGTCLNNVNANAKSLTTEYLVKTAALADVFRPYGIRVYLSPVLSAPIQLGGLTTSDPRDPAVAGWWKQKVDEIYHLISDFGGFQVKANSEGQPGPQDYGANHDDGANLLADALAPHGGVLLWRAFVYDTTLDADRAKCAYKEFVPLDGKFRPTVLVQVKNGPIDFQPREPFHPLLGAMKQTPLALELQITQEYLGQSIHLVYLAGMWKEILDSDTYAKGPGSTVARVVDGSLHNHTLSSIAGVANTGSDRNLWFHHVPWDRRLQSSQTLWEELQHRYDAGVTFVEKMKTMWQSLQTKIDPQRHEHVGRRLEQQLENACLWRQVCLNYFGHFRTSDRPSEACVHA